MHEPQSSRFTTPTPGDYQWRVTPLPNGQGLGEALTRWDALAEQMTGRHPMLDSAYVDGLLRHFGVDGVVLCEAHHGSETLAMCLLRRHPMGLGLWTSFLPAQAEIGPTLMSDARLQARLFAALPGFATQIDWLCSDPLVADMRGTALPTRSLPHALTMNVQLGGGFDDYWAQRPRKLIQNMRRYQRRMQTELGEVRFEVITATADLPAAVERYAALESSGWKGRAGTALSVDNAQGRFYTELLGAFGAQGQAAVHELWLGEVLLASRMMTLSGLRAVMLKTAYNEAFEKYAPGRILLQHVLEDLFVRLPGGVVEFCTNADQDLLAWSSSQRWVNHVSVYRNRALPPVYGAMRWVARVVRLRSLSGSLDPQTVASRSGATVTEFAHPSELPEDAKALLTDFEFRYVEFGTDWFSLLTDTVFAGQAPVRILVLRRQGRVLAVLPTVNHRGPLGDEVAALANFYTTLFSPALEDGVTAEDLLPLTLALRRGNKGVPVYRFYPMSPTAPTFGVLRRALRLAGLRTHQYFAFGNWYLNVEGDWLQYLKGRSGLLRSTIKRMTKRLSGEGGHLELITAEADAERGIAAYVAVYGASWKVPEPFPEFIPGLIRLCARRGWLRLGVAWIKDRPIAAQLWIVHGGRAHIYKVAYDEAYKAIAPGTLLSAMLMEHALDRDQVTEVDYLIGDDPYKKSWMSHRRERFGLVAYDPLTVRGLIGLLRQRVADTLRPARQWLANRREAAAARAAAASTQPPPEPPASPASPPSP